MKENYGDLFDYLDWRGDLDFSQSEMNVVDALVFSVLTYVNLGVIMDCENNPNEELELSKAGQLLKKSDSKDICTWISDKEKYMEFFYKLCMTKRFRHVRVCNYSDKNDSEKGLQFSATTYRITDKNTFIAFRGTDSTMGGWKEDMNMSFVYGTPSQLAATEYVNTVAKKYKGAISLGGHSKGGNLAVWSGVMAEANIRKKIKKIYNNDGPGFTKQFIETEGYKTMERKILSFVPEASIVGTLMCHCDYVTIKSTNLSMAQHDPFSWQILGKRFVYEVNRSKTSQYIQEKINNMFDELEDHEKEKLINEIFETLDENEVQDIDDFKVNVPKHLLITIPRLISKIKKFGFDKLND